MVSENQGSVHALDREVALVQMAMVTATEQGEVVERGLTAFAHEFYVVGVKERRVCALRMPAGSEVDALELPHLLRILLASTAYEILRDVGRDSVAIN